jgi:hypothetical protein
MFTGLALVVMVIGWDEPSEGKDTLDTGYRI